MYDISYKFDPTASHIQLFVRIFVWEHLSRLSTLLAIPMPCQVASYKVAIIGSRISKLCAVLHFYLSGCIVCSRRYRKPRLITLPTPPILVLGGLLFFGEKKGDDFVLLSVVSEPRIILPDDFRVRSNHVPPSPTVGVCFAAGPRLNIFPFRSTVIGGIAFFSEAVGVRY